MHNEQYNQSYSMSEPHTCRENRNLSIYIYQELMPLVKFNKR